MTHRFRFSGSFLLSTKKTEESVICEILGPVEIRGQIVLPRVYLQRNRNIIFWSFRNTEHVLFFSFLGDRFAGKQAL